MADEQSKRTLLDDLQYAKDGRTAGPFQGPQPDPNPLLTDIQTRRAELENPTLLGSETAGSIGRGLIDAIDFLGGGTRAEDRDKQLTGLKAAEEIVQDPVFQNATTDQQQLLVNLATEGKLNKVVEERTRVRNLQNAAKEMGVSLEKYNFAESPAELRAAVNFNRKQKERASLIGVIDTLIETATPTQRRILEGIRANPTAPGATSEIARISREQQQIITLQERSKGLIKSPEQRKQFNTLMQSELYSDAQKLLQKAAKPTARQLFFQDVGKGSIDIGSAGNIKLALSKIPNNIMSKEEKKLFARTLPKSLGRSDDINLFEGDITRGEQDVQAIRTVDGEFKIVSRGEAANAFIDGSAEPFDFSVVKKLRSLPDPDQKAIMEIIRLRKIPLEQAIRLKQNADKAFSLRDLVK